MMDVVRENSERRQWLNRSHGRGDDSLMTEIDNDGMHAPAMCPPLPQQRPRRIPSMLEASNNSRLQQQQEQKQSRQFASSMPPRRVSPASESNDHAHLFTRAQSLGLDLLEEWPRRGSCMEIDDTSLCSSKEVRKEVAFADYSSIHVYPVHEVERKKSYKSVELKEFKKQIGEDVLRVEKLIASCPYKRGNAVCHLIDVGALDPEELVGIDHLLCGEDASRKIAFERFAHAKLVVRKQREVFGEELAQVARKKSRKNVDKALMRARLAELDVKHDVDAQGDLNVHELENSR